MLPGTHPRHGAGVRFPSESSDAAGTKPGAGAVTECECDCVYALQTSRCRGGTGETCTARSGFTLIELAVVILTCALLGCMVACALARSGDGGKRAVCFNNLRQLGMAMIMYGNDNRDFLAPPNWDGGMAGSPAGWLYLASSRIPDPFVAPWLNNGDSAWQTGLWWKYMPNAKVLPVPGGYPKPNLHAQSAKQ